MKAGRTISARRGGVNWKMGKLTWDQIVARQLDRSGVSTAGDAHMSADAWAVVPAIDDEVVTLRFQADRAVDRRAQ
jgi:hypothetical protein